MNRRVCADVVVVGDGIAGSAMGQALRRCGVDVVLVGPDEGWHATYGTWADDVEAIELVSDVDVWQHRMEAIDVRFDDLRTIDRPYGVIDNQALRAALRDGVEHERALVASADEIDARLVVDATGWPPKLAPATPCMAQTAWQTAYGVVLAEPPPGPLGSPMLMDYSDPPVSSADDGVTEPSFAYALPVADGWLVEETVLAARPAIDPSLLVRRLAARLDMSTGELASMATRTETVHIPMGAPASPRHPPGRSSPAANVVRFGAAAGMIHPATGYSVATTLGAAGRVADAVGDALLGSDDDLVGATRAAVWPEPARRTRVLHDYGLSVLMGADAPDLRSFFDTFFDLQRDDWSAFLRIDTPPAVVARVMAAMFGRADWRLRRRLVSSNPLPFARLIRP